MRNSGFLDAEKIVSSARFLKSSILDDSFWGFKGEKQDLTSFSTDRSEEILSYRWFFEWIFWEQERYEWFLSAIMMKNKKIADSSKKSSSYTNKKHAF